MKIELAALKRESGARVDARRAQLLGSLHAKQAEAEAQGKVWAQERSALEQGARSREQGSRIKEPTADEQRATSRQAEDRGGYLGHAASDRLTADS